MTIYQALFHISSLLAFVSMVALGVMMLVFGERRMEIVKFSLFLFCVSMGIMGDFIYVTPLRELLPVLYWAKLTQIFGFFMPPLFLESILVFLEFRVWSWMFFVWYVVSFFLFGVSGFSSWLIVDVEVVRGVASFHTGPIFEVLTLNIIVALIVGFFAGLYRFLTVVDPVRKGAIRWLLYAYLFLVLASSIYFAAFFGIQFPRIDNLFLAIFFFIMAIAISKHDLMNVKMVVTRAVAFTTTAGVFVVGYLVGYVAYRSYFGHTAGWLLFALTSIYLIGGVGLFFDRLRILIQTPLDKKFLVGHYDPEKVMKDAAAALVQVFDRQSVLEIVGTAIVKNVELKYVQMLMILPDEVLYPLISVRFNPRQDNMTKVGVVGLFELTDPFIQFASEIPGSAQITQVPEIYLRDDRLKSVLSSQSRLLTMRSSKQLEALFILGPKLSEDPFTTKDFDMFTTLVAQAHVVFDRIVKHEELEQMHRQQTQIVEELIVANHRLENTRTELQRLNTELEEKVREAVALAQKHFHQAVFSTLASGMAHEIRNPMAAMVAGAGFLAESFDGRKRNPFEEYGAWERDITASDFADVASNDMDKASRILAALIARGVLPEAPKIAHLLENPVVLDDLDSEFVADIGAIRGVLRYLTLMGELFDFVNIVNQQIPRILSITDNMMRYGVSGGGVGRDSFTKIPGVTEAESAEIFDALRRAGILDPRGGLSPAVPSDGLASMIAPIEACLPGHLLLHGAGIAGVVWNTPGAIKRPVQVAGVLENSLRLIDGNCKKKRILIERDIPRELPLVAGDEHRLQQAFFNILYNAIQALETVNETNRRLTVRVHSTRFPVVGGQLIDGIEIQIQDTGPGIPSETKEKIFNPFFSTKGPTGGKNIGLGLSILSEVVSAHNGYIDVESELGVGTLFRIYLPKLG